MNDFDNWHVAPLPIDEAKRVLLLSSLAVLDTPHVAIALVSLINEHRQWFKSRVGQDICKTPALSKTRTTTRVSEAIRW